MKSKAYFQYYETFEAILEKIKDDTKRDNLRRVIIDYGLHGNEPEGLNEVEEIAFTVCRDLIDQQRHRREINAQNASGKRKAEKKPEEKKPAAPRFQKPTVIEIAVFCKEKGLKINAQEFFNYYESNGWRVGKNPMKSWQATAQNWAARDRKNAGTIWQNGTDEGAAAYADVL